MAMAAAGAGAAGSIIGGIMARKTAKEAMAQQADFANRAIAELEKVGIPTIEAQKIALENPELVFNYVPQLEQEFPEIKSQLAEISADPRLAEQQSSALAGLEERAEMGLTPAEEAQINALRRETAQGEAASQASILQQMARRGQGGSGAQLAAQLSAAQSGAQMASEEGDRLAAMQFQAKQSALQNLLQGASTVRGQEFGEEAQKASAADLMARYNAEQAAGVQGRNIGAQNEAELMRQKLRQEQETQRAALANQQQMYNKQLQAQKFSQEMAKAGAVSSALTGAGTAAGQAGATKSASQLAMMQGLGTAAAGAIKAWDADKDK